MAIRRVGTSSTLFIVLSLSLTTFAPVDAQEFIRGDCDRTGRVDMGDAVHLFFTAFIAGPLPCLAACDADDDAVVNHLIDGLMVLAFLFDDGPPIPPPFPECGEDPTPDLGCTSPGCPTPPLIPDPATILALPSATIGTDEVFEVPVLLDVATLIAAWSYGVCHDSTELDLLSTVPGADISALNGAAGPDFHFLGESPDGWTSAGMVTFLGFEFLAPGSGIEMAVATYENRMPPGVTTEITFCETLGDPPTVNLLVTDSISGLTPTTEPGSFESVAGFQRGDANGDGVFNGVVDGTYILSFGFAGGPAPPCLDAADADDNGVLNSIVDGLTILNYAYVGGPPPPPPALSCGHDPTADALDCAILGACPAGP